MTQTFCTLFDKNFLTRGLALYDSLDSEYPDFILWMMCFDDIAYDALAKLNLPKAKLLKMSEVEDKAMKNVKSTRTTSEYCWMFSSALPLHILEKNPELEMITYVDADMYFYSSPQPIYDEFGENSILMIPHFYSPKQKHNEPIRGTYNVGMMIFRNDENGLACLHWWKERCIEWCYGRYEDGKFGDQLYLNSWPSLFKKIHVLEHRGANVASWNLYNYHIHQKDGSFVVVDRKTRHEWPLIFYHFHGLKTYRGSGFTIAAYPITILNYPIYQSYLESLGNAWTQVRTVAPEWNYGFLPKIDILRRIKQHIQRLFHE